MDKLLQMLFDAIPQWVMLGVIYGFGVHLCYWGSAVVFSNQNAESELGWIPNWKSSVSRNHLISRTFAFLVGNIRGFFSLVLLYWVATKIRMVDTNDPEAMNSLLLNFSNFTGVIISTLLVITMSIVTYSIVRNDQRIKLSVAKGIRAHIRTKVYALTGWMGIIHVYIVVMMTSIAMRVDPQSEELALILVLFAPLFFVISYDVWLEKEFRNNSIEIKVRLDDSDQEFYYIGEDANTVFLRCVDDTAIITRYNHTSITKMTFEQHDELLDK